MHYSATIPCADNHKCLEMKKPYRNLFRNNTLNNGYPVSLLLDHFISFNRLKNIKLSSVELKLNSFFLFQEVDKSL